MQVYYNYINNIEVGLGMSMVARIRKIFSAEMDEYVLPSEVGPSIGKEKCATRTAQTAVGCLSSRIGLVPLYSCSGTV